MSGGGSGGSGTQKYEWNPAMEKEWGRALGYNSALLDKPYQQYQGQRIAPLNQNQNEALNFGSSVVKNGGLPVTSAANSQAQDTLNDTYLTGNMQNPYASASNPYSGFGSQFQNVLRGGLEDIGNAYKNTTAADTTRMFNQAGAFGGSAHTNAVANNEGALAKQMGNYVAGMTNDQFNRSAGLEDARLNRGTGAYEGERGRQMGAMGQGTAAQNNFFQGIQQLMGYGDIQRGYQQDLYNQNYADWQDQQNYPNKLLDYYTGILGRAQGGISPNMTTTTGGYQASPYSQILGAGLLGYGAFGGGK